MTALADAPAAEEAGGPHADGKHKKHRPAKQFGPIRWLPRIVVGLAVAYFVLIRMPADETYAPFAADAAIFAIVGLSLNILVGYTGQLSLGHNGFFGIGAFGAAYAVTERGVPFAATFVVAAVVAGIAALVMGAIALRITGLYLALITLVFGLTLEESLFEVPEFTNSGAGQPAERPEWLFDDQQFFYFCLAFLVVVAFLDWRLTKTKAGRALLALKENERVAEAFGVNVTLYKLLAFVLSGMLAGLAGALYAYRLGIVTASGLGFALALTFVLMTVVGGLGNRLGVILGSTLFAVLTYLLEDTWLHGVNEFVFRGENFAQFSVGFLGALGLLVTLVQYPGGIGEQIRPFTSWLAGKPFSLHPDKESGPAAVEGSSVRA